MVAFLFINFFFFLGGGGGENYTGRVQFQSPSPEWRVLPKFTFQSCDVYDFATKIKISR